MKIVVDIIRELLPLIGISLSFLTIAVVLLLALFGRAFFPEGNLIDILSVCLSYHEAS